jgi:hypothetical protein
MGTRKSSYILGSEQIGSTANRGCRDTASNGLVFCKNLFELGQSLGVHVRADLYSLPGKEHAHISSISGTEKTRLPAISLIGQQRWLDKHRCW